MTNIAQTSTTTATSDPGAESTLDEVNDLIDAARLPSIKDETRRIIIGFYYDET